jgi:sporulation protein YlmC with PRC-barrel domain
MEAEAPRVSSAPASSGGRPWLASRLLRRQVVNVSTLEPVGRVAEVAFDPERCQVTGLIVQPTHSGSELVAAVRRAFGRHRTVASVGLDHIIALNGDVVTVDSDPIRSTLSSPEGRLAYLCDVCELTIITLHGMCLGSLADLLLDGRGSGVIGYAVNPTKQAEPHLQPLEDLERSSPLQMGRGVDPAEASAAAEPSAARLRVIPASPRVRIGEDLILVVEEVEPLQKETVVITSQAQERTGRAAAGNGTSYIVEGTVTHDEEHSDGSS